MIIAEVGRNHLGVIESAYAYINKLAETSIDAITFQVREREYYLLPEKKQYIWNTDEYVKLSYHVKKQDKKFGIALADHSLVDFFESINTDFYKVIRNDINNNQLISKLIDTGKKIFLSTGMCSEGDILNFIQKYGKPKNVILNHTQLSNSVTDCNLKAIQDMKKYGFKVSYGTHCENKNVLYMSLCFDPCDIMFYVKSCDILKYPDNKHAIKLEEVESVIYNLISLRGSIGQATKQKMKNKINESDSISRK